MLAMECEPEPRRTIPVIGNSVVYVGRGLLEQLPAELTPANGIKASKFVIVSDENVFKLYGPRLVSAFLALGNISLPNCVPDSTKAMGFADICSCGEVEMESSGGAKQLLTFQVPHGEGSKSRAMKAAIEDFMLAHRCNRDTCMLALGGGVVGDLVGYVAATYMRGVPYVQIPTSSTAMIDSSVGGKTAINVPAGKNLIGAFWQPQMVYADLSLLETLGRRELVEGIAEAIKMGCIRLPSLFDLLEAHPDRIMALDHQLINEVIYDSVRMKAEVVAADEREAGLRGTLNWGHTIGHAIEAIKSPAMMHGECIAAGCVAEAELSLRMGYETLTRAKIERITKCFASYGLPINVPADIPVEKLMTKMSLDKKNQGSSIRCTIVTDIGTSITDPQPVDKALMKSVMEESMAQAGSRPAWEPLPGKVAVMAAGGQMSK